MGRIIVIDGTSNAGKTTLCENIERNIRNIAIIPGASLFAKIHIMKNIRKFQVFLETQKRKKKIKNSFLNWS